jgi:hypothetical protein
VSQAKEGIPCPATSGFMEQPTIRMVANWSVMYNQNQWWRVQGPVRMR